MYVLKCINHCDLEFALRVAAEMGLGKTVQIVTFLDHLFEIEKIRGPFLICVPLSTIEHVSASPHTPLGLAWLGLFTLV